MRPLAVYPAPACFNLVWIYQAGLTGSCSYLGLLVWSYVTLLPVSPIRRLAPTEPYASTDPSTAPPSALWVLVTPDLVQRHPTDPF